MDRVLMRPSISVLARVERSPDQAAAALAVVRAVADEIVVAVSETAGGDMGALHAVSDRVVSVPPGFEADEVLLLQRECSSAWLLLLEPAEVASEALVRRLGEPGWDHEVTHLLVPRRSLWGSPHTVLDAQPWSPDLQLRLVRNQPGLVKVSHDRPHGVEVAGWSRILAEPIYSLRLLDPVAEREEAVRRAERNRPGVRLVGGWSKATGLLLPERHPHPLPTSEVDSTDATTLTNVHGLGAGRESATPTLRGASDSSLDRKFLDSRRADSPEPGDGSVAITPPLPPEWLAGQAVELLVKVTNHTSKTWRPDDVTPVRVGIRVFDGDQIVGHEGRIDLGGPVEPGATVAAMGEVRSPARAGHYRMEVDLVREHVAWFGVAVSSEIEVTPARRIVVTGGFSPYRHLGDDLIIHSVLAALALELPDHEVVLLADDPEGASLYYGPPSVRGANPLLHRNRPASTALALRRIEALRRDAARVKRGEVPLDPMHAALLEVLAGASALVAPGAGWFTSKYRIEQMLPRLAEVEAARALGVPVLFESGTVGPFDSTGDRLLARRLLGGMARVTVRDGERSASVARRLGAPPSIVSVVPDAATAAEPDDTHAWRGWLRDRGINPDGPFVVVSVRDTADPTAVGDSDATLDTLVAALDVVAAAGIPALFLPHCVVHYTDDRPAGREVAARTSLFVDDAMPPDDVAVALIHRAALTIGNRFHLALVADAAGTPGLFLAATPFDALRSGAFTGGNIAVVDAVAGGVPGADAVREALARGRGAPAARWDPVAFGAALRAVMTS